MILALCFTRLDTPIYMHIRMICKQNSYLATSHVVAIQGISNDLMFFLDCKILLFKVLSKSYPTSCQNPTPQGSSVGSTQVLFLMCTLEIPQKIAAPVLALNLCYFALLLSFFLKLSLSLNCEHILYF